MSAAAPFSATLIDRLAREGLEGAKFPDPRARLPPALAGMTFLRLSRIERPARGEARFEARAADLLSSLHGGALKFAFAIVAREESLSVWLGAATSPSALRALADGLFPGLPFDAAPEPFPGTLLSDVAAGVAITGAPSLPAEPDPGALAPGHASLGSPFDPLVRGLAAARWTYLVVAAPVPLAETKAALGAVEDDIAEMRRRYYASADPAGPNRAAERAMRLLEAQHGRLADALHTGRWRAEVSFFAESDEVLGLGQGFLRAALAGPRSLPTPLRVHRLTAQPRETPLEAEPLTTRELARLAHPPEEPAVGYELTQGFRFGLAAAARPRAGEAIRLGRIVNRGRATPAPVEIALDDLTKHTLVVGVTGSGKTNTCMSILAQAQARNAPFLVIESAKTEYRRLIGRPEFPNLSVFTVGLEKVSPLRLNPFEVPAGVPIQSHIDFLKSLFAAAFVLWPPMPYVLETSLHEAYEDRGWNLRTGENARVAPEEPRTGREFPSLRDVVRKVEEVVDRMRYSGEVLMDLKAGLVARLKSLSSGGGKGPMFDTRVSTASELLFERPCILELHEIVSDEEKAFLIGLILIRLYEIRKVAASKGRPATPHITLIEEAHRLLRNVSTQQGGEVSGNPQGKAIEVFANVLAEVRAFGEAIVIAEQAPAKLLPDAIKNTNLKIVHRLLAEDDRLSLAGAMGLDPESARALAVLGVGEALVFAEGMKAPVAALIDSAPGKDDAFDGEALEAALVARRASAPESAGRPPRPLRDPVLAHRLTRATRSFLLAVVRPEPEPEVAISAYLRLESLAGSILGDSPDALLARATEIVDDEIERRGEYWGWSHGAAQAQFAAGVAVLRTLRDLWLHERGSEEDLDETLSVCARQAQRLLTRNRRPFAGCGPCEAACWHRYDAERIVRAGMAEDADAFMDAVRLARGDGSGEGAFAALKHEVLAVHAPEDVFMRRGLTFCCFVHILADERSRSSDEDARELAPTLYGFISYKIADPNEEEVADADG